MNDSGVVLKPACRYVHNGEVLEKGNHVDLMKIEGGKYASFWNLQAQDFL